MKTPARSPWPAFSFSEAGFAYSAAWRLTPIFGSSSPAA